MKVTTLTRFAFGFGVAAGLMVGFGTSPAMAQLAPTYSITNLGTLGGGRSQGNGVNTRRQVVGCAYPASGTQHAFLFENGVITDIRATFSGESIATDIDEFGRVVGYYDAPGGSQPFR